MMGPVSVMAFSQMTGFFTLFIFPALLKHSLLVGLVASMMSGFLGPGEPLLSGNFMPFTLFLGSRSKCSGSLASVMTLRYVLSWMRCELLSVVR